MSAITIQETLLDCDGARVVLANDADHGTMLGLSCTGEGGPMFVQIDRVTMLELERGTVDVRSVIANRCAGVAVTE